MTEDLPNIQWTFFGCTQLEPSVFSNLIKSIETGQIRPLVASTFPLEQIARAQEMFLEKQFMGKIVLTLD
ncbi:zinc-binding dehydrogenase [Roseofilum sp. SID3]|uniref:zinc-binding dehydrogenase n=1 Tax=unclassified Roseofilum TaxID=2620099 RepID=UPI001B2AE50C|nr:zinc-binding dehydrogenase [Roseofilum sp. Belize Diploria]MBP0014730.1 zinc-binding dehydrogenase [Roseofilum sp. SID3]MBP0025258.1 zinc-binding dehydrogenase [Roseofilum sp. SID2]MBP0042762.1 zinc-binding dehydrogenase [Roseofilum sp. SBFL]